MSSFIKPIVGATVDYWPNTTDTVNQRYLATICRVDDYNNVDLNIEYADDSHQYIYKVPVLKNGNVMPVNYGAYATWLDQPEIAQNTKGVSFSHALKNLKAGFQVYRSGWHTQEWLELQTPDENSKMSEPYIFIVNAYGTHYGNSKPKRVPYVLSHADVLAEDWHTQ